MHRMLIYKIARHIIILHSTYDCDLICTFSEGNRYVDVILTWEGKEFTKVQKFKLDPKTSTKILFTALRVDE
jgi:hypothetical protein